LPAVIAITP